MTVLYSLIELREIELFSQQFECELSNTRQPSYMTAWISFNCQNWADLSQIYFT